MMEISNKARTERNHQHVHIFHFNDDKFSKCLCFNIFPRRNEGFLIRKFLRCVLFQSSIVFLKNDECLMTLQVNRNAHEVLTMSCMVISINLKLLKQFQIPQSQKLSMILRHLQIILLSTFDDNTFTHKRNLFRALASRSRVLFY